MSTKVGQLFRHQERYHTDMEYREKHRIQHKDYNKRNKDKRKAYQDKRSKILNEFADKHCKYCGKSLHHATTSSRCLLHRKIKGGKPKKNAIQTNKS